MSLDTSFFFLLFFTAFSINTSTQILLRSSSVLPPNIKVCSQIVLSQKEKTYSHFTQVLTINVQVSTELQIIKYQIKFNQNKIYHLLFRRINARGKGFFGTALTSAAGVPPMQIIYPTTSNFTRFHYILRHNSNYTGTHPLAQSLLKAVCIWHDNATNNRMDLLDDVYKLIISL